MNDYFIELCAWFNDNKRDFPWRKNVSFYSVWVSEVMLQQTRAEVVVPYYEKWMKQFPDLFALAKASSSQVIKCWEGLGYYSRARNLHQGARQIISLYGTNFPDTEEQLIKIKGLGPYTVGAILSFAYNKKALAIDGNVLRVLSRFFLVTEPIDKTATRNKIAQLLEKYQPVEKSWVVNEALIELGALICQKKPKCSLCPLRKKCLAYQEKKAECLPNKEKKISYIKEKKIVLILENEDHFLVRKNDKDLMKDLYEFPYLSMSELETTYIEEELIKGWVEKAFSLRVNLLRALSSEFHSYTRYRVELFPYHFSVLEKKEVSGYTWQPKYSLDKIPFSSGHRRIKERIS